MIESVKRRGHDYFAFFVCRDPVAKLVSTYKLVMAMVMVMVITLLMPMVIVLVLVVMMVGRLVSTLKWANGILKRPLFMPRYNLARSKGRGGQEGGRARAVGFPAGDLEISWLLIICTIPVWYRSVLL